MNRLFFFPKMVHSTFDQFLIRQSHKELSKKEKELSNQAHNFIN